MAAGTGVFAESGSGADVFSVYRTDKFYDDKESDLCRYRDMCYEIRF